MGVLSDMEIVVISLNWKRPIHLDPYILGNAPTTAVPSGNMPTLKLENGSKKHCSSMGGGCYYEVHTLFLDTSFKGERVKRIYDTQI